MTNPIDQIDNLVQVQLDNQEKRRINFHASQLKPQFQQGTQANQTQFKDPIKSQATHLKIKIRTTNPISYNNKIKF